MFNTQRFAGRTAIITGASRGIGKEIALKLAKDGANIVVAAKTTTPHPKLPGTIFTAAEEIEKAGGKALACAVDVRDEKSVQNCVEQAVKKFGGIDILINNASAISLTGTLDTEMKRYDLMHQINTRGTFLMSKTCVPYLKLGKNPHILNLSPPLVMDKIWFKGHVAYTMAKYGMSMCVLGMHEEFRPDGIAVNALWPMTAIWTAALEMLSSGQAADGCRKPEIVADAAYALLSRNSRDFTGNFVIDEEILKEEGVTDFDRYAVKPGAPLIPDGFLPGEHLNRFTVKMGESKSKRTASRQAIDKDLAAKSIDETITAVGKGLSVDLVKSLDSLFVFKLTGDSPRTLILNLKEGAGSITEGAPQGKADVEFTCSGEDFARMFSGELSALSAFSTKRLAIKGDMRKAISLDGFMQKMSKNKM